jgi:predicted RNase H-like HicB family nuclease
VPMLAEVVHAGDVYRLPVILREGEDGYIVAICPILPGTTSQGRTREEALTIIREAIALALESAAEEGWALPFSYSVEQVEVPG